MKSTSNVNAAQAPSTGAMSSRLQVRIRTGQEQALPKFSFQTLFADIKPKAFEEISKSTLARRDEQMRLEKSRREQQPREQDMMAPAAPEPRREPERVQKRESVTAPAETTAARAPERRAEGAPARPDAARADAPRDAGRDGNTASAASGSAPDASSPEASAPPPAAERGQPAQQAALSDAAASSTEAPASDEGLQQVVADALAQIEAEAARAKGGKTQADGTAGSMQPAADALEDGKAVTGLQATADASAEAMNTALTSARAGQPASGATLTAQAGTAAPQTPGDAQAVADGATKPGAPGALLAAQTGAPGQGNTGQNGPGGKAPRQAQQALAGLQESAAARAQPATALPSTAAVLTANGNAPSTGEALPLAAANGMSRADGAPAGVGVALPVAGSHSPVRADGSPLISSRIDSPINSTEFKEQFARQLAGLVVQGQDRAEIRLTPAELGPIRIRVSLNADDAQLDISAAHASTRAAIESSMSTLRQMLSEQGIRLADYRMDNGQNPAFAQNRQSGQEHSSATQQFGTASGQEGGSAQGEAGQRGRPSTGSPRGTSADRSTEVASRAGGGIRATTATGNGRVDLFA